MESIVERKATRWHGRIHRRWFLIYDPIRFYAKERYIIEKIVKAIITVLPMEQKKRERWKSVLLCECERRKESGGEKERRSVYFFMVAGMRASKGLPSATSFSISMRR